MSYPENVYTAAQVIKRTESNASSIDIAQALYAEDLLMPVLPEPYSGAVRDGVFKAGAPLFGVRSVEACEDQVIIHGKKPCHAPISQARSFALALLAACDYAEKEQEQ